jgi:hypothetical protein
MVGVYRLWLKLRLSAHMLVKILRSEQFIEVSRSHLELTSLVSTLHPTAFLNNKCQDVVLPSERCAILKLLNLGKAIGLLTCSRIQYVKSYVGIPS